MNRLYMKLFKKIISLTIITVLPLSIYLYSNNKVITTVNSNIKHIQDKYIIEGKFEPGYNKLIITQKVLLSDKPHRSSNNYYFYFNSDTMKIESITFNNSRVSYKVINNNILKLAYDEKYKSEKLDEIEMQCIITVKNDNYVKEIKKEYRFNVWYPVLIAHDSKGWSINNNSGRKPNISEANHNVKLLLPQGYKLLLKKDGNDILQTKVNKGYYHINLVKEKWIPIIIRKK